MLGEPFEEPFEEPVEIAAGELPGKGLGDLLVTLLEGEQTLDQSVEVCEVARGEYLALDHREVDLDLVVLTPVGGQTRVSDRTADEGSPHNAGSNTKLPAGI